MENRNEATESMFQVSSAKRERSIYKVISSQLGHLGAMPLNKIIQGNDQHYVSPFFIVDEFGPMLLSAGAPFRVDAHPHAGIIPTTYLLAGNAHHRDSMGNDFQYHEGDFIQFTSGSGALHMEETGDELFHRGGYFHGIQTWLNIPPELKRSAPNASLIRKKDIPVVETHGAVIRVILGTFSGKQSRVELLMPVFYWHISLKENITLELPVEAGHNAFVYLLSGHLEMNGNQSVNKSQVVLYERDGDYIRFTAKESSELLVLGGAVNNEPYVSHGPFVLNTAQEIQQAYRDFEAGKFGDIAQTNGVKRK